MLTLMIPKERVWIKIFLDFNSFCSHNPFESKDFRELLQLNRRPQMVHIFKGEYSSDRNPRCCDDQTRHVAYACPLRESVSDMSMIIDFSTNAYREFSIWWWSSLFLNWSFLRFKVHSQTYRRNRINLGRWDNACGQAISKIWNIVCKDSIHSCVFQ